MTQASRLTATLFFLICHFLATSVCVAQCPDAASLLATLDTTDANEQMNIGEKLEVAVSLKEQYERCRLRTDSVYARILHKLGLWDYLLNNSKPTEKSIAYTLQAIRVNTSNSESSSPSAAVSSYNNVALFFKSLKRYNQALLYFDSTILLSRRFVNFRDNILTSRYDKDEIYFQIGDYERCIEESTYGIFEARQLNDSIFILGFLNQRGQSNLFQGNITDAKADIDSAIRYASALGEAYELASAFKIKAFINEQLRNFAQADTYFARAIKARIISGQHNSVANDYLDFGNFHLTTLKDYSKAKRYYVKALTYSPENSDNQAAAYSSLGYANFLEHNYPEAESCFLRFLKGIGEGGTSSLLSPLSAAAFNRAGNNEMVLASLSNITEYLLRLFKETGKKDYLHACLRAARVTDTLITSVRYMQMGERSKLYWRNRTREFFTNAIEACYLNRDAAQAFYFMEKSRAVLLNDKLNELGAAAHLPDAEGRREQEHQARIIAEQQQLSATVSRSSEHDLRLAKLLEAKEEFKQYVRSLEKKYPAYYQYKYADSVPLLSTLQHHLRAGNGTFVHYFSNDTVTYVLAIRPDSTRFLRLANKEINYDRISQFLLLCSDKVALNNNYPSFASVSNGLYRALFEPLGITSGRVIICPDNFIIPFEALCSDEAGKNFLIYNYIFSYVYSARYLLKDFDVSHARGNFIGFAPVSFSSYAGNIDLRQSASSLERAANYYSGTRLFTGEAATKRNFITQIAGYKIVNVFSHARADTTDNEPILFMHDSVLHLSELQLLRHPAIELVVLSACQTNVGRNAAGEGIYSLARGFASAGIPSVAATLWKADENMIYEISEKFHEYLAKNMPKDEALQQAKLRFMQNGSLQKQLPYFWANMILIGNAEPIDPPGMQRTTWLIIASIAAVLTILTTIFLLRRSRTLLTDRFLSNRI